MERGANWERDAVRDRWAELERQRRATERRRQETDRLLLGLVGVFAGLVLLLLSMSPEMCSFTPGGAATRCRAPLPTSKSILLGGAGLLLSIAGAGRCRSALTG